MYSAAHRPSTPCGLPICSHRNFGSYASKSSAKLSVSPNPAGHGGGRWASSRLVSDGTQAPTAVTSHLGRPEE
jgi:hypothetical protein